jgi:hypothetical protein
MKKLLTVLLICFSLSVSAQTKKDTTKPEKVYTLKLTETQINNLYNVLEFSKSALPTSDASAKSVNLILQMTQIIEELVAKQYNDQADKKPK